MELMYKLWFRVAIKVLFTATTIYAGVIFQQSRWQFMLSVSVAVASAVIDYFLSFQISSLVHERVYGIIESCYNTLGFLKSDRVRITVFTPCFSKKGFLKQLIKYCPTNRYGSFRRGLHISKGITGLCFRKKAAIIESINQSTDFEQHMIDKWGFTDVEAATIRQRRNYLALPVLDKNGNVSAVVYMDSEKEATFTPAVVKQALRVCIPLSKWL